ncbi:MAG: response regulator [Candidatus Tritonobacter lacicola]|nr:response regulator [Candidatus Tritonobacter lacicola]
MEEDRFLTLKETAEYLRVHPMTVRRWALAGRMPCFKVGRQWRFSLKKLAEWTDESSPDQGIGEILIVDDEENIRDMCRRYFEGVGCRVRVAADGREALARIEENVPDILLLDLRMPGMDGPATLGEVRKRWPEIPVTIITAYGESALMERALDYTPFTVVKKPFTFEKLLQAVQVGLLSRQVSDWPWRKGGYRHGTARKEKKLREL